MNKVENCITQRLSVSLIICIALLCSMASCTKSAKPVNQFPNLPLSQEIRVRLDSMNTKIEMPDDLTEEDQIAYIENQVLTTPVSAAELLALQPIHTLDPTNQEYLTDADWKKFALMNRFMRMQYVALGDPTDELNWAEATQTILNDYATPLGITRELALDSILSAAAYLCCGTQYQINQCLYVQSSVEYYKTLAAYKDFIEQMPEDLQTLLYEEYAAWNKLNKARHNAYVNIVRAGEHYSALPMEYEEMYAAYAEKRRQLLDVETQILSEGKEYRLQHPVVRTANWEGYLQTLKYRSPDDEALAIVQDLDETVRTWISVRQKIARQLPAEVGKSYDNLTADYHWAITNEEEQISSMYEL